MGVNLIDVLASAVQYMNNDRSIRLLIRTKQIELCLSIDEIFNFKVSADNIYIGLNKGTELYLDFKSYDLIFKQVDNEIIGIRLYDEENANYVDLTLIHSNNSNAEDLIYGILDDD